MSAHNIGFYEEISKIMPELSSNTNLISSSEFNFNMYVTSVEKQKQTVMYVSGSNYYVRILSTIDRELLKPSASVALHKHSNALVDVLPPEADSSITMLGAGKTQLF